MRIHTVWIKREGCENDSPEFVTGIDEYTMDSHGDPALLDQEANKVLATWEGCTVAERRVLIIKIPDDAVESLFHPTEIEAEVE